MIICLFADFFTSMRAKPVNRLLPESKIIPTSCMQARLLLFDQPCTKKYRLEREKVYLTFLVMINPRFVDSGAMQLAT